MFLGILSIFQVLFIPGYICFRFGRVRAESLIEALIIIVSLSLITNYLFAYLFSVLGFYNRIAAFSFLLVEIIILFVLLVRDIHLGKKWEVKILKPSLPDRWLSASAVIFAISSLLFLMMIALAVSLRFNVFHTWDPLFSWNRWAYEWASGIVPKSVSWYPQLIPANWSMMYLFTGNRELQLFPMSIMPWFGIAILLMFLDLGLRKRRIEYLAGLLLCVIAVMGLKDVLFHPWNNMVSGYVDLPLTFFVAASFYLLELRDSRCPASWKQIVLPLLIAGGAAVTKASGMYAVAVVLVLALIGHFRARLSLSVDDWIKSVVTTLGILLLVPGSWFVPKVLDVFAGRDFSNYTYLSADVDVSGGAGGPLGRLVHSVSLFPGSWVTAIAILVAVVVAISISRTRWVALGIFLPYSILWALFLSYDLRNWMAMIPVLAYLASSGIGRFIEQKFRINLSFGVEEKHFTVLPRGALKGAALLAIIMGIVSLVYPSSRVIAAELDWQKRIGDQELNKNLYKSFKNEPTLEGELLTDYGFLQFLPDFRNDPMREEHTSRVNVQYVSAKQLSVDQLKGKDILVLSNLSSPEVQAFIRKKVKSGEYSVISTNSYAPIVGYYMPSTISVIRVNNND